MRMTHCFAGAAWLAAICAVPGLIADQVAVVTGANVNVRGRPTLSSEVITQLQSGDKVVWLEPAAASSAAETKTAARRWVKIQIPDNTPVWVYARYIETNQNTVAVNRLNIRTGPGENHEVIGRLSRGASVKPIRVVNGWMEIEPPAACYGYVAANYLKLLNAPPAATANAPAENAVAQPANAEKTGAAAAQTNSVAASPSPSPAAATNLSAKAESPAPLSSNRPPESAAAPKGSETNALEKTAETPALTNTTMAAKAAAQTNELTSAANTPAVSTNLEAAATPAPATAATNAAPEAAPALRQRIVRREGILRSTFSVQAPTYFELINPETRHVMNYLHSDDPKIPLKDFRGRKVVVTGEEGIDERWPSTPVLEVQTFELSQ